MKYTAFVPTLTKSAVVALTAILVAGTAPLFPGCGPPTAEFSKEAQYTPETLAQEFTFRYQALPANASTARKAKLAAMDKAKSALPNVDEGTKSAQAEAKKEAPKESLETLLDEFEVKLGKVSGKSKTEAAKSFLDLLGTEKTVKPDDLKTMNERLSKAG